MCKQIPITTHFKASNLLLIIGLSTLIVLIIGQRSSASNNYFFIDNLVNYSDVIELEEHESNEVDIDNSHVTPVVFGYIENLLLLQSNDISYRYNQLLEHSASIRSPPMITYL